MTKALGEVRRSYYDYLPRLSGTVTPDGSWATNRYNLIGQVTNTADSAGTSITNWPNNRGRVVTSSNAFGQISFAAYDNRDRVTNSVDANGISINTTYDVVSRVLTKTYPYTGVEKLLYSVKGLIAYTSQLGFITRVLTRLLIQWVEEVLLRAQRFNTAAGLAPATSALCFNDDFAATGENYERTKPDQYPADQGPGTPARPGVSSVRSGP